jgi:PAS domain-containing protein
MDERRRRPTPADPEGYLDHLPALTLLDRLPTATLGLGPLGDIAYANRACAEMLSYADGSTVTQLNLPDLLTGHEELAPEECLDTLRTAVSFVEWNHRDNYVIRTMLSPPLLLREADTLLLLGIADVTAFHWETGPPA